MRVSASVSTSAEMEIEPATAIKEAASLLRSAKHLTAFTGAGISVASGIPPLPRRRRAVEPL